MQQLIVYDILYFSIIWSELSATFFYPVMTVGAEELPTGGLARSPGCRFLAPTRQGGGGIGAQESRSFTLLKVFLDNVVEFRAWTLVS